jgi:mRNA interferase RelE/StbE
VTAHLGSRGREKILNSTAIANSTGIEGPVRAAVRDALERHLRYEPQKLSRSRVKRLRGLSKPKYRSRVGEVRVFYDVEEAPVEVLAIVLKSEAAAWLGKIGKS